MKFSRKLFLKTCKTAGTGILLLLMFPSFGMAAINFKDSVVKIYVTIQREDYKTPWQPTAPNSGTGSGFIIQKKRILTNAHVVSDARFIEIQREGDPNKYQAEVVFYGHDCDLAILTVQDASFFDKTRPLPFGSTMPSLNDEVIVLGYPMGGERISLTKGVVSRIDNAPYTHSGVDQHLAMQVDAAINPGNSGGPVLYRNSAVGVAFQGIPNAQNLGYAIPLPVIRHFLEDIEDGHYDGYPELGADTVDTRNPALRASLKLDGIEGGVAVTRIDPFGSAKDLLLPGDVLMTVDGFPIADDGTTVMNGQTIEFTELVERKQCGETMSFDVLRNGTNMNIKAPLLNSKDTYIFRHEYGLQAEYYICGGLVFTPITRNMLFQTGKELNQPIAHHLLYYTSFVKIDGLHSNQNQYVVLSERLAHRVNTYDSQFLYKTVSEINGQPVRQMSDLPRLFGAPVNNRHVIRFRETPACLVLDASEAQRADRDIMKKYYIQSPAHLRKEGAQ